ncbi:hypothetical protein Taro_018839 [Colocasia esculenta]|uniref:Inositol polyphosphate-related phosphatase domain-containing protein n=1 Tax=Colocasia esculenta TaxID=4460 RepID=A0A843V3N0_COLES|nr:hypothetical protein [Colocasia esculenta]
MRVEDTKKSKLSWSKSMVRKWFSIKNKAHHLHADDDVVDGGGVSEMNPDGLWQGKLDLNHGQVTDVLDYRIFASTWNVGGKSPPNHLNLEGWLQTYPPADIYVLGFQEIVPLNAGNVLGTEDNGPAKKWVALIRSTLNNLWGSSSGSGSFHLPPSPVPDPIAELHADFEGSSSRRKASSLFHRRSFQSASHSSRIDGDIMAPQTSLNQRLSVCDRVMLGSRLSDYDPNCRCGGSSDEDNVDGDSPATVLHSPTSCGYGNSASMEARERLQGRSRYCLVASKQMVGIFLTVWVRSEIKDDVRNMKVSCVGRGLMGYLGNKGSISISMLLHQTSFCFICCHLTSGQKEGDELRRNADVLEILRKTRFPQVDGPGGQRSPETILKHEYVFVFNWLIRLVRIIWLGDLNYRIALSFRMAKALVEMHNWKALLEKDQLRGEQRSGRVFIGWKEGTIYFPPTYKYSSNSDRYSGESIHLKEKRRTPAWCDRILWYGKGLNQLSYVRGESRFSDHRPVYSIFTAEVESVNHQVKHMNCSSSRVEAEELLPCSHSFAELGVDLKI